MKRKVVVILSVCVAVLVGAVTTLVFAFPEVVVERDIAARRRAAGLELKSVQAAGHTISYLDRGSGEPVVMLHGFGGDKHNWLRMAEHIPSSYRVVVLDLPGFGESSHVAASSYSYAEQAQRLHAFIQALGLSKPHLVGNSMGGAIAGVYASEYADKASSVALIAPASAHGSQRSELEGMLPRGENPLLIQTEADMDQLFGMLFVEKPFVPGPIKRYIARRAVARREITKKVWRDAFPGDEMPALDWTRLRAPALVLWGDSDRLTHVSGAERLRADIPGAKVVIMKRCGHLPMMERDAETAQHYLDFLRSVRGKA